MSFKMLMSGLILAGGVTAAMNCSSSVVTRVSLASDGSQSNAPGYGHGNSGASVSNNGRYIVFTNNANNLVENDTNDASDVFVHDTETGETKRVSVGSNGEQGNSYGSYGTGASSDGRFILFYSYSDNLIPNDTNANTDIFVHDREAGETSRVSIASDGSEAKGYSESSSISPDGRYISFTSVASNLVSNDNNNRFDVFVHDRDTGETSRVSVSSNDEEADGASSSYSTDISAGGRYVVFASEATNLVENDTNGLRDIFIRDRQAGTTTLVSVASDGTQSNNRSFNPSVSDNGSVVVFRSTATNLVSGDTSGRPDVFAHYVITGETIRISIANDGAEGNGRCDGGLSISGNGRYVVFSCESNNLVSNDVQSIAGGRDAFMYDLLNKTIMRYSVASDGSEGNGSSSASAISYDGKYALFSTHATNFSTDDTNASKDVYLFDRDGVPTTPITDPANIELSVLFDGLSTKNEPGPALSNSGNPATWKYTVKNTGDEPALNVRLFQKALAPIADNSFTLLCDLGEVAGGAIAICDSQSLVVDGKYKAIISAQGVDQNGNKVKAGAAAYYVGGVNSVEPSLSLYVLLNGSDNDNISPGEALTIGDTANFTYYITNTGPVEFTGVRVFDRTRSPESSRWGRACEFSYIPAGETVSCEREATVESGSVERQISVQSFYQSEVIRAGEFSYYTGQ